MTCASIESRSNVEGTLLSSMIVWSVIAFTSTRSLTPDSPTQTRSKSKETVDRLGCLARVNVMGRSSLLTMAARQSDPGRS
jgi:hypothetical protein